MQKRVLFRAIYISFTDDKLITIEVSHFLVSLPKVFTSPQHCTTARTALLANTSAVILCHKGNSLAENFRIRGCNNIGEHGVVPALQLFSSFNNHESASSAKTIYSRFHLLVLIQIKFGHVPWMKHPIRVSSSKVF